MKELWLNFKDEKGEAKRVLVEGEKFVIGRTPDNDLQIPLNSLSREHARIERFADVFIITDCGSSNGSTLNDEPLEKPVALKHEDKLNLGNAIDIEIEIPSDKKEKGADGGGAGSASTSGADGDDEGGATSASSSASTKSSSASASAGGGSSSLWLLMLAPILMVLVLLGLGGAILIARSKKEPEVVKNDNDFITSKGDDFSESDDKKTPEKDETPTPTATVTPISTSGDTSTPINSTPSNSTPDKPEVTTPTPKTSNESEKVKVASASFLRRIAGNDPNVFLLEKNIAILSPKINQFKGSGALAENIKNAKSNSSKIVEMAKSKNLKPLFLATAALAKLGNQRGDVAATAQGMVEILDNLSIVLGNEGAYDNLLVIAAYEQGAANENLKMRDKVARLTQKFPNARSQTIRTIWFLKENGELSDSEFNFALQFLAIGTITQNPKEFNVSAEALVF
ncbi:MAG: FHA domain-containing protein [Acidobacteriota bacterium]